jgi:hypothetical protein
MGKKKKNTLITMGIMSDIYGQNTETGNNSLYGGSVYDGDSICPTNMTAKSE